MLRRLQPLATKLLTGRQTRHWQDNAPHMAPTIALFILSIQSELYRSFSAHLLNAFLSSHCSADWLILHNDCHYLNPVIGQVKMVTGDAGGGGGNGHHHHQQHQQPLCLHARDNGVKRCTVGAETGHEGAHDLAVIWDRLTIAIESELWGENACQHHRLICIAPLNSPKMKAAHQKMRTILLCTNSGGS